MTPFSRLLASCMLFIASTVVVAGTQVSGRIDNGLRLLEVPQGDEPLVYTVFRGDYLVFNFADGGQHQLSIPELGIEQLMPKPATEKPYVKIKKSGDFRFSLGERQGTLHVLELVASHYKELTAVQSAQLLQQEPSVNLIDVRTAAEFKAGHIPGAKLFPVQQFAANIDKLEALKNQPVLLYCASGNRSTVAAKMLIDAGFTNIYNMRRGIADWRGSQLPVQ